MPKGLEALKTVKKLASAYAGDKYAQAITEDIEKELKAIEIIKKKCYFIPLIKFKNLSYDLYVRWFDLNQYDVKLLLTREEFDLLKGILNDEQ